MRIQKELTLWWRADRRKLTIVGILFFLLSAVLIQPTTAAPLATFTPPTSVTVTMYELNSDGSIYNNTPCTFDPPDTNYGCTWTPSSPYPYPDNPVTVPIETDYLLDVLSQEMGPAFHPTALQAGAVAMRSYVFYLIDHSWNINNSTQFQAFIPYRFESLTADEQQIIQTAVAPRYYLAPSDDDSPAVAMHFSDVVGATTTNPNETYLVGVNDPISTSCDASTDGTSHNGMSQRGAGRWARGNQCSTSGNGDQPWGVKWGDFRQIIVHYYTGVHLRDANNNNTLLTPEDRWNPLLTGTTSPLPLVNGSLSTLYLLIQNTSTWDWSTSPVVLGYQWTPQGAPASPTGWTVTSVVMSTTKGGEDGVFPQVLAPSTPGAYDLHWDVARKTGANSYVWFSAAWPHLVLPFNIAAGGSISQSSDDAGPNASVYSSCTNNFSTNANEIYLGHCSDGTDVISGFRFQNIQVPAKATIVEAHLDFAVDGPYNNAIAIQLYGELSASSATFSSGKTPAKRTPPTNSSVLWTIPAADDWEVGQYRSSPDVTPIIQEIVNLNKWSSGNPITILVKPVDTGTTHRRVIAWDRHYLQPARLVITYR